MPRKAATELNDMQQEKISSTDTVKIRIPKESGESSTFFIGLNGQNFLVPRGVTTEVPAVIGVIYAEYLVNRDIADSFSDNEQKRMSKIEGAPV